MNFDFNYPPILPLPNLPSNYPRAVYTDDVTWYQDLKDVIEYTNTMGTVTFEMQTWLKAFIETYGKENEKILNDLFIKWSTSDNTIELLKVGVFDSIMKDIKTLDDKTSKEIKSLDDNKMNVNSVIHWSQIGADVREHIDGSGSGNYTGMITDENIALNTISRNKLNFYGLNTANNKFDKNNVIYNKYLNDGILINSADRVVSEFIKINKTYKKLFLRKLRKIAFYDENKVFIVQFDATSEMQIPDKAVFFRTDSLLTSLDETFISYFDVAYDTPKYTDQYLNVKSNNIGFPVSQGTVTKGLIKVNSFDNNVVVSKNTVIDYGYGSQVIKADKTLLLNVGKPSYLVCYENELFIADEYDEKKYILILTYLDGSIYTSNVHNIKLNEYYYYEKNDYALVAFGNILINVVDKTILVSKDCVLSSYNDGNIKLNLTKDLLISYNDSVNQYLVYNKLYNRFEILDKIINNNYVVVAQIFGNIVYTHFNSSNVFTSKMLNTSMIDSITYATYNKNVVVDTVLKTIKIEQGETPFSSKDSLYFLNNEESILDFSTLGNIFSLYLKPQFLTPIKNRISCDYYVDVDKRDNKDIKVFTVYNKKVYTQDDIFRTRIYVDGVKNGGFGEKEVINVNKYENSIASFYNKTCSFKTKSLWLGDSSWVTFDGTSDVESFISLYEKSINKVIDNQHIVDNKSVGGVDITYFSDRIETLVTSDYDVCFIGCSLNNVNKATVEKRTESLEKIIKKCLEKNVIPVLVNSQANQVPNTITGDNWTNRKTFNGIKYDEDIRKSLCKKYDLDLIDLTLLTYEFLKLSTYPISDLLKDGLHGSSLLQPIISNYFVYKTLPYYQKVDGNIDVELYSQYYNSEVSLRNIKAKLGGVFKTCFSYTETAEKILQQTYVYVDVKTKCSVNIVANCSVRVVIENSTGVVYSGVITVSGLNKVLTNQTNTLLSVTVYSVVGSVDYQGIRFIKEN